MLTDMLLLVILITLAVSLYMHKKNAPLSRHAIACGAIVVIGGALAVFVFYKMAQSVEANVANRIDLLLLDMLHIYAMVSAVFLGLFLLLKVFRTPTAKAVQSAQGLLGILILVTLLNSAVLITQDFQTKYNYKPCAEGEPSKLEKPYPSLFQLYFDIPTTSCEER